MITGRYLDWPFTSERMAPQNLILRKARAAHLHIPHPAFLLDGEVVFLCPECGTFEYQHTPYETPTHKCCACGHTGKAVYANLLEADCAESEAAVCSSACLCGIYTSGPRLSRGMVIPAVWTLRFADIMLSPDRKRLYGIRFLEPELRGTPAQHAVFTVGPDCPLHLNPAWSSPHISSATMHSAFRSGNLIHVDSACMAEAVLDRHAVETL